MSAPGSTNVHFDQLAHLRLLAGLLVIVLGQFGGDSRFLARYWCHCPRDGADLDDPGRWKRHQTAVCPGQASAQTLAIFHPNDPTSLGSDRNSVCCRGFHALVLWVGDYQGGSLSGLFLLVCDPRSGFGEPVNRGP